MLFRSIEIIIVNDCSPDLEDDKICQEYADKDNRIVYVKHEKNLGLGGARNTGIKIAKADHIGFVDSDDWIDPGMYLELYEVIQRDNSDVVCCGYRLLLNDKLLRKPNIKPKTLAKNDINIFTTFNPSAWNKLWKKALFLENDVFFPEKQHYEDLATIPKLLYFAYKVSLINESYYNYIQRDSSITHSFTQASIDGYKNAFHSLGSFLQTHNSSQQLNLDYCLAIVEAIRFQANKRHALLDAEKVVHVRKLILTLSEYLVDV